MKTHDIIRSVLLCFSFLCAVFCARILSSVKASREQVKTSKDSEGSQSASESIPTLASVAEPDVSEEANLQGSRLEELESSVKAAERSLDHLSKKLGKLKWNIADAKRIIRAKRDN